MPRNGSGTFVPPPSSWNPAINGNAAGATDWNALLNDIANGVTQSVSRDGQSPMTGPLSLAGNRITNVGQASDDNDALRRAQIIKGEDIASSASLPIPIEGAMFDVTGATTITSLSDVFPGRLVVLRFIESLTLTHSASLALPTGGNIKTEAGDLAIFVNTEFGKWAVISYQRFAQGIEVWGSQPIGVPFPLWGNLTGVTEPPANSPFFRYVKLTASDGYNAGILINQSVSGTAPNITAVAQISLPESPMNGTVIPLINTERIFLRPGNSGNRENGLIESHTHTGATSSNGDHSHTVASARSEGVGPISNAQGSEPVGRITSTGSAGLHSHTFTTAGTGGAETRPRNIGATYYMRIL